LGFKPPGEAAFSRRAQRYRLPVAAGLCFTFALLAALPTTTYFVRLGGDFLTPLAAQFYQQPDEFADAPVALVVIDEITHQTPPFSETPEVAWTPFLGEVMMAIAAAEPAVIGLDMIFPKSIASRTIAPGYDRSFLQALAKISAEDRLVLAEARLSDTPIRPYTGQEIAVGGPENIRPVHLTPDRDNVVRRHPAFLALENGDRVRSFAAELSARSGAAPSDDILIDYITPAAQFPTYRFSDLYACYQQGDDTVFELFRGKVVLIGTALDIEDRHIGANRLQREKAPKVLDVACGRGGGEAAPVIYRASMPGVFVEARAVYTFLKATAPQIPQAWVIFLSTLIYMAGLSYAYFRLGPAAGVALFGASAAGLWTLSAVLLAQGILAPIMSWIIGGGLLYVILYSYRVILEDQSRRWVTHAFEHYLNPALVSQLAEHPEALRLGGERRRVAVLFADLAGFTTTAEQMADRPEALVAHLNHFFQIMTENIEAHDGYIDKFIGDAVMGVWGAPASVDEPERRALSAALACVEAVDAYNVVASDGLAIKMRIGISAGEVIAGNLGSKDRFNYTVIGDAVNRAARLEQKNKQLKTQILLDASIADHLPAEIGVRFIEETQLHGQAQMTKIYTPEKNQ